MPTNIIFQSQFEFFAMLTVKDNQTNISNSKTMSTSLLNFFNEYSSPVPKTNKSSTLGSFLDSSGASFKSPVSDKLKAKLNHAIRCDGSVSELSQSVNDSAGGKRFDQVYRKKEVLGEGGFAIVYRCIHKNRRYSYAVKEVLHENYEADGEDINEEINAMKRLRDGPYIVRLLDVFRGPTETHLVMEQMKGGDLLERLIEKEVFSEYDSRRISRRLIEAVVFCHKKNIVHRDIKLENILLTDTMDDTKIKLGDFGCSRPFIPGKKCLTTLCGSPQYAAPELYMHEGGYDERCDIWSIGVVIFVLLGGYAPFEGSNVELPGIICEGYYDFLQHNINVINGDPDFCNCWSFDCLAGSFIKASLSRDKPHLRRGCARSADPRFDLVGLLWFAATHWFDVECFLGRCICACVVR